MESSGKFSKTKFNGKPKIIVIVGPTASGKSDLAIRLAKKINAEIVSADSRQIYKEMNIGTAKPLKKEMAEIPHYLIDIKKPNQDYTLANYKKDAIKIIARILKKNKLPILVGGTGLYIDAVIDNFDIPRVKPNKKLRNKLEKEIKTRGLEYVFEKLTKLDPEAVNIIDRHNPRRVIRAFEITLATGVPFSSQRRKGKPLFNALKIGISLSKEKLKERIERRVDKMIKQGLVKEVKNLIKKYSKKQPIFSAISYKEIISYLRGNISLKETTNLIKTNTWQYSRRQMTWFRQDKNIHWFQSSKTLFKKAKELVKNFLKQEKGVKIQQ